jgi:hypothetical protein
VKALGLLVAASACACALTACGGGAAGDDDAQVFIDATVDGSADAGDAEGGFGLGQVDRAGRPLVALLLVPGAQQDDYNSQDSFEPSLPVALQNALQARLVELDTLALGDGGGDEVDWPVPDGGQHPLLGMFASDTLLVDTARPCAGDAGFVASYFDIERELYLGGMALDAGVHTTCGGRSPNENVVDETLTLIVTAGRVPVSDGVDAATNPATTQFPYFAKPN